MPNTALALSNTALALCSSPDSKPLRIFIQILGSRGNPRGRIIKKGNASVRVTHHLRPVFHSSGSLRPVFRTRFPIYMVEIDQVEQILQDNQVIHRAALKVTAVCKDLLTQFSC